MLQWALILAKVLLPSASASRIHRMCVGRKGSSRYLTMYKKESSTIVQADAVLDLGRISRQLSLTLLQRFPVSAREKQELLPPTERDRMINQDGKLSILAHFVWRDVNRTTGRLNNGIPQVPPRRGESEYMPFRQSLPIWFIQDEIINSILRHQVILLTGETGTGKTTQYETPTEANSRIHRMCVCRKGSSRYLTMYKKESSTIVQADAVLDLGRISRQLSLTLLQRFPVSAREKQELLPPTERDRMINQDGKLSILAHFVWRDVNRTTGRLNNGIPQVPPRRGESEYMPFRQSLPIWFIQDEIINSILRHQVILLTGETGTGKTTQVPQYILDHSHLMGQQCRIICSQPRRLATLAVAERVAAERDEKVGQTVGFQIRLESRVSPKTVLTFCTNGVLLRTLMGGDATDEVHERDKFSDFLLLILRDLLLKFRNLKLILMSANLDTQLFVKYFGNCPIIEVPGRVHEVKEYFLEDILRVTNYSTKAMAKYRRGLRKVKDQRQELQNWCSQAVGMEQVDTSPPVVEGAEAEPEVVDPAPDMEEEPTGLNPHLAHQLDYLIKEAWMTGEEFLNLLNLIIGEGVSVDYQHRETGMTALMVAAGRGHLEVAEQLLTLGANTSIRCSKQLDCPGLGPGLQPAPTLPAAQVCLAMIIMAMIIMAMIIMQASIATTHTCLLPPQRPAGCSPEPLLEDGNLLLEKSYEPSSQDQQNLEVYHHCFNDDQVDVRLILFLLRYIIANSDEGAVLIFLPGYDDIVNLREMILTDEHHLPDSSRYPEILFWEFQLGGESVCSRFIIYTLHSQIQSSDQKRVFKVPPPGVRKIVNVRAGLLEKKNVDMEKATQCQGQILATNMAETSITINDVVYVINSGKVKEKFVCPPPQKVFDSLTGVTGLRSVWVSQASATQRRGRAGRCRPGICYHLFSRQRYESLQLFSTPEILCTPIHELCLQAKLLAPPNISIADFLARAPDPPSFSVTRSAVTLLKTIDSLDPWEELTELGLHLLDLPIDPRLGKMVLYSVVLKCLDPVLTIVCALAYKDPCMYSPLCQPQQ
ncbi:YTHDC2 [Cordylochernes scorpioides]|uniref:YTHDC2 n=1 Tax=Cordylochernes scorpioides TaxID=51811 RepID=A0ABY6LCG6_9ARAC|nr:YTHDC2 [Cordylochernes scorpioides]